jgi:alpha-amylase/alpha-mannosidase (GH57 family)
MHQPFYKDLITGEYRLPWTRMHALKDYYGMVKILEDFPSIRQTFNLVPSLLVQLEEYAHGEAKDPFLALALKPAETLTQEDREFLLRNFFLAEPARMIYRFPRYGELYTHHLAGKEFGVQDYRDLQMLSQLAWFDEEIREKDPEVRQLMEKGRNYSLEDQILMGRKQTEICALVIPEYAKMAKAGQIEISTTPFYHPILPLICDSDIGGVSHPGLPLPPRFRYPDDALLQLIRARKYVEQTFGVAPAGLWPSEGSVSDEALKLAAAAGFQWAATDDGVLGKTLDKIPTPEIAYRPYVWERNGNAMRMIFRDHMLSDLIGFAYSGMGAEEAASDFLRRIHQNCAKILANGRDALVPIILDGENAWEFYDRNGRPFFRALYADIAADPRMEALTVSEACSRVAPASIDHVWPGSWIDANFNIWIGAEEDNHAWRLLLAARQAYDAAEGASEDAKKLAMEQLLIAEGSDWNWWYGPEHDSPNRPEFDELYREHLSNVYRTLGLAVPLELSDPILRMWRPDSDSRFGSMHGEHKLNV